MIAIGTNAAQYYSQEAAYQGVIILVGAVYFLFIFRRQLLNFIFFKDYLFVLFILVYPLFLMMTSIHSFERGTYTSLIGVVMVFLVASILRSEFKGTIILSISVVVVVGVTLNLYELFIENNIWSTAPGRSAGFYVNPNISSSAILGYGLTILLSRTGKIDIIDQILISLIFIGVFVTFSRAGIISATICIAIFIAVRVNRKYLLRIIMISLSVMVIALLSSSYIYHNMPLSFAAKNRLDSLIKTDLFDNYNETRGRLALDSVNTIKNPFTGEGVRTVSNMIEGPHNMFIAIMIDYGYLGLFFYLAFIARLIMIASYSALKISEPLWFFILWLCLFSLASHNLLEEIATIPILGFAMSRAYQQINIIKRHLINDRQQYANQYSDDQPPIPPNCRRI